MSMKTTKTIPQLVPITTIRTGISRQLLPLYSHKVNAGFPSPADDYIENSIDLTSFLVSNPASTFLLRVQGDSMIGAGIYPSDIIIVDKSRTPRNRDAIVAVLNGEFTIKRLIKEKNRYFLQAENPDYKRIPLHKGSEFQIWGVITYVLHNPNSTHN